jgi:biotin carboxyl carrier protein
MNRTLACLLALLCLGSCRKAPAPAATANQEAAVTNRIDVPDTVRRNLGIEFVKVERRRVAQTLRVPGHFELLPEARHELRTPIAGRVEVLVRPLQAVAAGDAVYRIDSPAWRQLQRELGEITTQIRVTSARIAALQPLVAAHREHEESLGEAIAVTQAWVGNLEETRTSVGGQARELAEARAQLAQNRAGLAEAREQQAATDATLAELQANLGAAHDRLQLGLEAAAAVVSMSIAQLQEVAGNDAATPAWRRLGTIEVRAAAAGVVDRLPVATGVWVESGDLVVAITDLAKVRFRARGLQSDLPDLRTGLPAVVIPARGRALPADRIGGELMLGVEADPEQRTVDLFCSTATSADWARPGVAGFLEIETRSDAEQELAIPLAAALQDGLQRVLFRRDPADPDKVIRVDADLGLDDGRWVAVKSGLRDGDEVVLAGAYELMLASSGTAQRGGHFHADGTFHQGGDKDK